MTHLPRQWGCFLKQGRVNCLGTHSSVFLFYMLEFWAVNLEDECMCYLHLSALLGSLVGPFLIVAAFGDWPRHTPPGFGRR